MRLPALALALLAIARAARDLHENCQRWAEGGECSANPKFMQENCAVSCSKAKDYSTQIQKECAGYAQMGECSRNPAFMLSTCRRECDAWEAKEGLRIDRDSRCVEWSIVGVSCDRIGQFQELTFPSCEMIVDNPYQLTIRAEESTNQISKSFLVVSVQFVDQLPRI